MKSELFEDFDMIHRDPKVDRGVLLDCSWESSFAGVKTNIPEFPIQVRRERYHRTSGYVHLHRGFYAIYIVRAGRGIRYINGQTCSLARGDIFIMTADSCHAWREPVDLTMDVVYFQKPLWPERDWELLLLLPDLASFLEPTQTDLERRDHIDHFGHLTPETHAQIEAVFKEMRREYNSMKLPLRASAKSRFYTMLVQLAEWRASKTFTTRPAKGAGIAEVLEFCESNFHRPLTNQQLAALMHFSEGHFREVFLREVGISPGAYLRHLRLQHAQKLLANRSLPVADVARMSGFEGSTQFGRAFKGAFGISPGDFRKGKSVTT